MWDSGGVSWWGLFCGGRRVLIELLLRLILSSTLASSFSCNGCGFSSYIHRSRVSVKGLSIHVEGKAADVDEREREGERVAVVAESMVGWGRR